MRIATYNVHSCMGSDGRRSVERVAEVIASLNADVIALQELDHRRPRSQHVHQAAEIARLLTMDFHFHAVLRVAEEEYGDAILSPHPLRLLRAGPLPTVERGLFLERRGALWVEVSIGETKWHVVNTHFGLGRAERLAQAQALLNEWLGNLATPFVVCGDFNSHSGGRVHRLLCRELFDAQANRRRATFPAQFPILTIDHVFHGPSVSPLTVEVPRTSLVRSASDHLPLVAELLEN